MKVIVTDVQYFTAEEVRAAHILVAMKTGFKNYPPSFWGKFVK